MAATDALTVGNWFLWRAAQDDPPGVITNLKLQKLVYYAQAWHLALSAQPLFDDRIEAWVHGPVVPSLYFEHKESGWTPIICDELSEPNISRDIAEHLQEIWTVYGGYDGRYLEMLTHREAPWKVARGNLDEGAASNQEIPHHSMRRFYQGLLAERGQDAP